MDFIVNEVMKFEQINATDSNAIFKRSRVYRRIVWSCRPSRTDSESYRISNIVIACSVENGRGDINAGFSGLFKLGISRCRFDHDRFFDEYVWICFFIEQFAIRGIAGHSRVSGVAENRRVNSANLGKRQIAFRVVDFIGVFFHEFVEQRDIERFGYNCDCHFITS